LPVLRKFAKYTDAKTIPEKVFLSKQIAEKELIRHGTRNQL
jgi:hypothetical protein